MSFQYKIRGEQFVQFERQSQDYIEQRDQDLESSLNFDFSNLDADNLTSGTVPSARITGSYTGITGVGTLTVGSIPATLLTGTVANLRLNSSYTNIINMTASGTVTATLFDGSGANLTSIPNSATTASSSNVVSTIVSRNGSGNFSANQINATLFDGSGANLTSIPAGQLTGTVASARISGSYTGITGVGTLAAGSIPATLLTGTVASARISGAYSGITDVGTLGSGLSVTTNITATGDITISTASQEFVARNPTTGSGSAAHWVLVGSQYRLYRFTSTIREKENIQTVGDLLNPNMIDAINVQLWNRKTAPGIPEVGPMAEEMDAISPFLSTRGMEWDENGAPIPSPVDGINSNSWLSLLTIAIQDLRQRLQQLETT